MAIGANALWIAPLIAPLDNSILILLPLALVASILPDIDAAGDGAKIHYIGAGAMSLFRGMFFGKYLHHRGLMHSIFIALTIFALLLIFTGTRYPALPYVFAASYISHSIIDGFNYKGVGYFYPFNRRMISLLPKLLRTPVKGPMDNLLFFIGCFGFFLFCVMIAPLLIQ